jgi:hypothetical protein
MEDNPVKPIPLDLMRFHRPPSLSDYSYPTLSTGRPARNTSASLSFSRPYFRKTHNESLNLLVLAFYPPFREAL